MNKEFFQQLFCKTTGNVYQFLGTVPENVTPVEHITVQLMTAADNTQLNTVVVALPEQGITVIYVDDDTVVVSDMFSLITDLVSPVVIEEIVEPTPVIEDATPPLEG